MFSKGRSSLTREDWIPLFKDEEAARPWWLAPVIPATQEAESRRIEVQS
jgi:hypothetical protein